jgi:NUMOD3 motif/Putative endonuclease segE, GIY-YIG domain
MKPYTYLIKHRPTGQVYYGVRSANKVEPHEDLWNKYYTSSPKVQRLIEETGKDSFDVEVRKVFETKEQAVAWETKVLRRCKVLHDARWLNQNVAGYIIPTEESNKKISDYHKGKPKSESQKEKIRKSNIGKNKGRIQSNEHRRKNSDTHKGQNNPRFGAIVSEETRRKISEAKKGKQVAHNKGVPMSEEQKAKIRATKAAKPYKWDPEALAKRVQSQTGAKRSPETKAKIAAALKAYHAK